MDNGEQISTTAPKISVVIAVYNDWTALNECLLSLQRQANPPNFEVIVVDDGSNTSAPEFIQESVNHYPLILVRQPHQGISTARNRGVRLAKGSIVLFTDADCKFDQNCFAAVVAAAEDPAHDYFQLHLTGDRSRLLGRAEELRLSTFQSQVLQPDGCIRYLNTAGFAVRRSVLNFEEDLFNPKVPRGEDTLLLVRLMQDARLPFFVPGAIIEHAIPLSLIRCLGKDVRSAYLERPAYEVISAKKLDVRVRSRDRFRILIKMWKNSSSLGVGRSAWLLALCRQSLQRMTSLACWCLRLTPRSKISAIA
jgi:glycosyltransferase involved in cell wall biosynthesis